jgi:cytosine/adenosine deaminase-related metal-dependent hydrolase
LRWHSFVEVFGANPDTWRAGLERGLPVLEAYLSAGLSAVLAPHASYSVAPAMLAELQRLTAEASGSGPLSIHLQESPEEEAWFREGSGAFGGFFEKLGLALSPPGEGISPATAVLNVLAVQEDSAHPVPLILVHNTMAGPEDIALAAARPNTYWCFCPRANRYITGRLPRLEHWLDARPKAGPESGPDLAGLLDHRILIGTDSLASNARLSIHAELQELAANYPDLSAATMLRWACGNGAAAFGWSKDLGALEPGRAPGLVWLKPSPEAEPKAGPGEPTPSAKTWFGPGSSMEVLVPPGQP